MADPISNPPTLSGFVQWGQTVMGIPTTAMSPTDPGWNYAFQVATDLIPTSYFVNLPDIYTLCVYNCGGSLLIQFQQDYPGQTYWSDARAKFGVNNFVAGVINSASDSSTSEALAVGQGLQNLTLLDLQRIKDPYGRMAWAYLQSIGTLWGIS